MATNPYVNKVEYGNNTLIDLTNDTATEQTVLEGYTFHGADGQIRTGTAVAGGGDDKMDIDGTNADTSVTFPDSAFTVGSRSSSIDVGIVETYVDNVSALPYKLTGGAAVVYNNKIHILGGTSSDTKHYSLDGTSWVEESTLPYTFYYGSAVVYNNKIHILGGSEYKTKHYSWNGTSWVEESTLPYNFYNGSAVVYNNKIHILGTYQSSGLPRHYSWDRTSWVEESTLPYSRAYYFSAVVYNGKIHILGSGYSTYDKKHYSWDGTSWVEESTIPYSFKQGSAVVYDNKIHILGTYGSSDYDKKNHYSWNGSQWFKNSQLPFYFYDRPTVAYGDKIHIFGGYSKDTDHISYESYHDIIEVSEPEKKGTFVQGDQSMAAGDYSYARGYNCLADGDYSKAEGINAYALSDFQHVSKGSSNKFDTEEFAAGRSLYNNVINTSLTYQTAIDGRYGCSGTVNITTNITIYIKIDPQGVYLLIIAANNGSGVAGNNTIQLISYYKVSQLVTSGPFTAQFYTDSGYNLYDIIYFYNTVSSSNRVKLQFTLIRLI